MHEGQWVASLFSDGPPDSGQVVEASGNYAHVLWKSGALAGQISLHPVEDLAPAEGGLLQDSLDYGHSEDLSVDASLNESLDFEEKRDTVAEAMKTAGEKAFLSAMASLESDPSISHKMGSYGDEMQRLALKAFAVRAVRDYLAEIEEG